MLYLLDDNVLIAANRDYYPLGRIPEFWGWLVDCGVRRRTKIPVEMYEEVLAGKDDDLTRWLQGNRDALRLGENVAEGLVVRVTESGYAPDLSDEEVERVGRDPFLIAYQSVAEVVLRPAGAVLDPRTCRAAVEIAEIRPIGAVSAPSAGQFRPTAEFCHGLLRAPRHCTADRRHHRGLETEETAREPPHP